MRPAPDKHTHTPLMEDETSLAPLGASLPFQAGPMGCQRQPSPGHPSTRPEASQPPPGKLGESALEPQGQEAFQPPRPEPQPSPVECAGVGGGGTSFAGLVWD